MPALSVVLAEDSVLLREGLTGLLARFGHEVVAALESVAAGGTVVDPEVVRQLLRRRRDPLERLTPREREVLGLVAEGKSNGAIARALVVTEAAVGKHIGNVLAKLDLPQADGTHRRVLAVLAFLKA